MSRLTWKKPDGTWGLVNGDIKEVPREYYGYMCKLKDYEETGLDPNRIDEVNELYLEKCKEINLLEGKLAAYEVAKEYGNTSDSDLEVVSALPSLYPLQPFEEEAIHKVVESVKNRRWIPVEQKSPEDFTDVYVTCISLIDDRKPWVTEGIYNSAIGWKGMAPMLEFEKAKVIAWMPKKCPAPYQKGDRRR